MKIIFVYTAFLTYDHITWGVNTLSNYGISIKLVIIFIVLYILYFHLFLGKL